MIIITQKKNYCTYLLQGSDLISIKRTRLRYRIQIYIEKNKAKNLQRKFCMWWWNPNYVYIIDLKVYTWWHSVWEIDLVNCWTISKKWWYGVIQNHNTFFSIYLVEWVDDWGPRFTICNSMLMSWTLIMFHFLPDRVSAITRPSYVHT